MHLNNQLCNAKWGGHDALIVAMQNSLHSITNMQETTWIQLLWKEWAKSQREVEAILHISIINYVLKAKVAIILHLQLCSTCFRTFQTKKTSLQWIWVASENVGEHNKASGKLFCPITNWYLALSLKRTEIQRRTMICVLYVLWLAKSNIFGLGLGGIVIFTIMILVNLVSQLL